MDKTKRMLVINILAGLIIVVGVLTFYGTFSLNTEYVFESSVYSINDRYIEGISINTSVELFYKYFDIDNCSIKVVDKDNKEITSGYVTNGSKTILYGTNGNVLSSYINIIKGDYNRDGLLNNADFYEMGKCLVENCSLDDYLLKSIDIDGDKEFHINDLTLLDKAMVDGYKGISIDNDNMILQSNEVGRLVSRVIPEYGVNSNVKWESTDISIAVVDNAGRVTGVKEGKVVIRAITLDGKYSADATVIVDNTIQLSSYEGLGYIGGNNIEVKIKSVDYDGISCSVSNEEIASCKIDGKKLILSGKKVGDVVITVNSSKYGSVTYDFVVRSVYLNIIPNYICLNANGSHLITLSGFNMGNLSFSFSDNDIIKDAYMTTYDNRKMLRIDAGGKQGRAIVTVFEDNGNTSGEVVVDVTSIRMAEMGVFGKIGEDVSVMALGDNLGEITCKSDNESLGTCRVVGNEVIVSSLGIGVFNINVYNNFTYNGYKRECGQTMFVVVVQE